MLGTVIYGAGDVRLEERPEPKLLSPDDAVIAVVATCVCGSDLWAYRGISPVSEPRVIGHELVGIVEQVGANVNVAAPGDFVIVPFSLSCGKCQECLAGYPAVCENMTMVGGRDRQGNQVDGAQGEKVRIPLAQGSLFPVGLTEQQVIDRGLLPDLLALSDVMSTGYHAAVAANVQPGDTVAVVGDGAVGLCAVIGAKLRGAQRIIIMSRHADRAALAVEFGATDVVAERGESAAPAVRQLLDGRLADVALECVGTRESMEQAMSVIRGGGRVGFVGVPAGGPELNIRDIFTRNITVGGGMASARRYMAELLPKVLDGEIHPGKVFDLTLPLSQVAKAYKAMDNREATKVMLIP